MSAFFLILIIYLASFRLSHNLEISIKNKIIQDFFNMFPKKLLDYQYRANVFFDEIINNLQNNEVPELQVGNFIYEFEVVSFTLKNVDKVFLYTLFIIGSSS